MYTCIILLLYNTTRRFQRYYSYITLNFIVTVANDSIMSYIGTIIVRSKTDDDEPFIEIYNSLIKTKERFN